MSLTRSFAELSDGQLFDLVAMSEGKFAVAWALQHALDVNPGGIKDPIEMATLERGRSGTVARMLDESDTAEHRANVQGLEEHIAEYQKLISGDTDVAVPEVKKPKSDGA